MAGIDLSTVPATTAVDLTTQERGCLIAALDLSRVACDAAGHPLDPQLVDELRAKLEVRAAPERFEPRRSLKVAPEQSRPQELAADAMAAKHGRSHVQPNADGSVVITGLLDDIERERVCIEVDGRERWRD